MRKMSLLASVNYGALKQEKQFVFSKCKEVYAERKVGGLVSDVCFDPLFEFTYLSVQ